MAKTFTEVETRKAPISGESNAQFREEQQRQGDDRRWREQSKLAFIIAPLAVAAATGLAVLTFRSLQSDDRKKGRRR